MAKEKDLSIETLRGLAIILMVAGHVIGDTASNGMRVADGSEFRHLYYSLQFFRMPLFTVISGFVYTLRPVSVGHVKTFMQGKARRILFPLVSVATLQFLMRLAVPGVNKTVQIADIWQIYIYPFDHFWFLQAIFLVFVTVTILERFGAMTTVGRWALVLVGALLLVRFAPRPTVVFSFPNFLYLFPFFLCGIGLGRFPAVLRSTKVIAPAAVLLAIGLVWQQGAWYGWTLPLLDAIDTTNRTSPLGMTIGLTGCVVLFRWRWETRWLAWLGFYSYGIYLFHVFGTAGSRIVSSKLLHLEAGVPLFVLSLCAGLAFPIALEQLLLRFPTTRLLFLGLRPKRADAKPTPAI